MIKIARTPVPAALTPALIASLTAEFKTTKASVWNKPFIKDPLRAMSHGKCCYCETIIDEESKYMEVEHFQCKKNYPDLVVQWHNLLPACKRCNGAKGEHDVLADGMIVNPDIDDPRAHFYLLNYRLVARDQKGKDTIDVIDLNDSDRLVNVRFKVGEGIYKSLGVVWDRFEALQGQPIDSKARNKIIGGIRGLLREAQPTSEYSATAAFILLSSSVFGRIKERVMSLGWWDGETQAMHDAAAQIALNE